MDADTCQRSKGQISEGIQAETNYTVFESHEKKPFRELIRTENSLRLMFSMLFRNQISTENSTHAGKYFHKSEADHEHTGTSEREITCPVDSQQYEQKRWLN